MFLGCVWHTQTYKMMQAGCQWRKFSAEKQCTVRGESGAVALLCREYFSKRTIHSSGFYSRREASIFLALIFSLKACLDMTGGQS